MTHVNLLITMAAVLGVLGYYCFLWIRSGSHQRGSVVTQYAPPRGLSPAMLRYVWKERFDDRTFWACVLSLVSKGLISLEKSADTSFVRRTAVDGKSVETAQEEKLVLKLLFLHKKRESLSIEDATTAYAISQVAQELRKNAVGKWFSDNRKSVIAGAIISLMAVCVAANPNSPDQLGALLFGLGFMIPGGYYLFFVLLRFADLVRAAREHFERAVFSHIGVLLLLLISCIATFIIGGAILAFSLGSTVVSVTGLLVAVNVGSLLWLRMPTKSGQEMLDAIDGFREYLKSVEQFPMDKPDAPSAHAGLYEKYLPYAVALEVEQWWSDKFVAVNSSYHEHEFQGLHPFYLGTWDGKPVEVAFKANPSGREY